MARVYGGFIDEMQAAGKILRRVDVSVPQSESNRCKPARVVFLIR
jgi:hypothetical protein